jgi:hypothetical protein
MNIILIKFKKIFKNMFCFKHISSHKHWSNLLKVFFILVILLLLFNFYLLYQVKNEQIFQIESEKKETPDLINEKLLDKINKSFELKSYNENEIRQIKE